MLLRGPPDRARTDSMSGVCDEAKTMSCRVATGFVSHDLDFSQPTPMGFAQCRRCGGFFTVEQYLAWRCEGASTERKDPESLGRGATADKPSEGGARTEQSPTTGEGVLSASSPATTKAHETDSGTRAHTTPAKEPSKAGDEPARGLFLPEPKAIRMTPGALPCALCGDPVFVDPMHRAVLEWFGGTCDACFNLEPAHV